MNTGVFIMPWSVFKKPARALQSVDAFSKVNKFDVSIFYFLLIIQFFFQ